MDTLKAISSPPYPSPGPTTTRPPSDAASAVAMPAEPVQIKLVEESDQENKQQISKAVNDINDFFQMTQRSLGFSLDESSGKMVMQITDSETHEVIRQIPGDDILKLAKHLDDLTGVLFKAQA